MPAEKTPTEALDDATRELWQVSEHVPSDWLPTSDEFNEFHVALNRVEQLSDQRSAGNDAE